MYYITPDISSEVSTLARHASAGAKILLLCSVCLAVPSIPSH